jgi:hypothetical protein
MVPLVEIDVAGHPIGGHRVDHQARRSHELAGLPEGTG